MSHKVNEIMEDGKEAEEDTKAACRTLIKEKDGAAPHFDDLDSGWAWMVFAGCFGTFYLMGTTQFASGIVHMILLDKYQASVSLTSVAGAIHVSLISIGAPLSTYMLERYSCRVTIIMCGCLFFAGYFGTAFAPNIEFVIFTYGVVAGLGGALGYTANMVVVGYNFHRKRKIAMGIAVAGAGVGIFFLSNLMQYIYTQYGSFGFFLLISGIFAQCIVFGMICRPSKLELYTKSHRTKQTLAEANKTCLNYFNLDGYISILTNKAVLCLSFGLFNLCLGSYLVFMHLPHYIVGKGFKPEVAANLVSLTGILTVVGRILTGAMATVKCIRDDYLYCLPKFILGIMTIVYPYMSNTYAGHLTYIIILGLLYGNVYVLIASMTVKHVGIVNLAKAIGIQYFFAGIGALLGPIIAGVIVDAGGTYDHAFYTAGVFLILACVSSGMTTITSRQNASNVNGQEMKIIKETNELLK